VAQQQGKETPAAVVAAVAVVVEVVVVAVEAAAQMSNTHERSGALPAALMLLFGMMASLIHIALLAVRLILGLGMVGTLLIVLSSTRQRRRRVSLC